MFYLTQYVHTIIILKRHQNETVSCFTLLSLYYVSETPCACHAYSRPHSESAMLKLLSDHTQLMATTLGQPRVKPQCQGRSLKLLNLSYWDYKMCFTEIKWEPMKMVTCLSILLLSVTNGRRGPDMESLGFAGLLYFFHWTSGSWGGEWLRLIPWQHKGRVSFSWGCCDQVAQTGWLQEQKVIVSRVLEARRSRWQQCWSFWGCEEESASRLLSCSGWCLSHLWRPLAVEPSSPSLPSSSLGVLLLCVSVSAFPLFIRTVALD